MRFSDFKELSIPEQAYFICQRGVLLTERRTDTFIVALYQLEAYYVEVYYRAADNEIVKFISFHDTVLLEPYLNNISIKALLLTSVCW